MHFFCSCKKEKLSFDCWLYSLNIFSIIVFLRYVIAFILLWKLNTKVVLLPTNIDAVGIARYLKSGMLRANSVLDSSY